MNHCEPTLPVLEVVVLSIVVAGFPSLPFLVILPLYKIRELDTDILEHCPYNLVK